MAESQYRRVVLKLSGEAFADTTTNFGIDAAVVQRIAEEVAEARRGARRRARGRGRRRQHLAGHVRRDTRHGPRPCRLHGHARHGDQRAGTAGLARGGRPADAGADRDHDGAGGGAVHPASGDPAPREGPGRRVRGRAPATRTSPPTPPPRCGRRRSAREAILKGTHSGVDGVYSADPRLDPDRGQARRR